MPFKFSNAISPLHAMQRQRGTGWQQKTICSMRSTITALFMRQTKDHPSGFDPIGKPPAMDGQTLQIRAKAPRRRIGRTAEGVQWERHRCLSPMDESSMGMALIRLMAKLMIQRKRAARLLNLKSRRPFYRHLKAMSKTRLLVGPGGGGGKIAALARAAAGLLRGRQSLRVQSSCQATPAKRVRELHVYFCFVTIPQSMVFDFRLREPIQS